MEAWPYFVVAGLALWYAFAFVGIREVQRYPDERADPVIAFCGWLASPLPPFFIIPVVGVFWLVCRVAGPRLRALAYRMFSPK